MRSLLCSAIGMATVFASGFVATQDAGFFRSTATVRSNPTQSVAQTAPTPAPPAAVQQPKANPFNSYYYGNSQSTPRWGYNVASSAEGKLNKQINDALRGLKSDDREKQQDATDKLTEAVGKLFDARTETREKQITDLEERLAKLRKQVDERKARKAEICKLHVQTLVNQANGLGF